MLINPHVEAAQYAVRGELAVRAEEITKQIDAFPFDRVILCNIGNPQNLGQRPLTFLRQVLAVCEYPEGWATGGMPADVLERYHLLGAVKTGAYTDSKGLAVVRSQVAAFLKARDGEAVPSVDPETIFLTNGASAAIQTILTVLVNSPQTAIMLPIPQYPLYSASVTLLGGSIVPYYLTEEANWELSSGELERAYAAAVAAGLTVAGLVVINPGNPTGNLFTATNLQHICEFCAAKGICLLADEVYQENTYLRPFCSAKRAACQVSGSFPLFSFHSVSKGLTGECGKRGGYVECFRVDACVLAAIYKLLSIGLCSSLSGQLALSVLVAPPQPGSLSFELFSGERTAIFGKRLA